jgi:TonB family protein
MKKLQSPYDIYKPEAKYRRWAIIFSLTFHSLILFFFSFSKEEEVLEIVEVKMLELKEDEKVKKKKVKKVVKEQKVVAHQPAVEKRVDLFSAMKKVMLPPKTLPPLPNLPKVPKIKDLPKFTLTKGAKLPPLPAFQKIKSLDTAPEPRGNARINLDKLAQVNTGAGIGELVISRSGGLKSSQIMKHRPLKVDLNFRRTAAATSGGVMGGEGVLGVIGKGGKIDLKKEASSTFKPPPVSPPLPQKKRKLVSIGKEKKVNVEITGALAGRKVLRRPLPPCHERASLRGSKVIVQLRISVTPAGRVKDNVLLIRASGIPEWDRMIIEVVKKWLFAPLPAKIDQSGFITFVFVFK